MARQRVNFYSGVISSLASSTAGATTTITGNGLGVGFPVPSAGNYIPITLNPGYFGANNTSGPEIAYITPGGSSTIANVTRVVEGSVFASGTNVPWVAGPVVSDFDVSNLTSTGTLTLNNVLVVSGGGTSISAPNGSIVLGNSATVSGEIYALNTGVAIGAPNGNVVVGGNLSVSGTVTIGNLSVSGTVTIGGNKINNSWYSNTLVSTGYLPNGSIIALPAVKATVSGYLRYMIVANSSYTNSTGTTCNVWSYVTDSGFNQSTLAYTNLTGTGKANLGNNFIVTYADTGPMTISLNVYSDQNTTGRFGAAEISVIGLS